MFLIWAVLLFTPDIHILVSRIWLPRIWLPRIFTSSYPGFDPPRTPDLIPLYPGFDTLVPRIWYPRTPDLIPSYPGFDPLVPRTWSPRTPDLIPSYPGFDPLVPRIGCELRIMFRLYDNEDRKGTWPAISQRINDTCAGAFTHFAYHAARDARESLSALMV